MKPTLTLTFESFAELQAFITGGAGFVPGVLAHADRPDVGAALPPIPPAAPAAPTGLATVGFGVGVTLPAGAIPAPSIAAAAAAPIAPEVNISIPAPAIPTGVVPSAPVVAAPAAPVAPLGSAPVVDSKGLPWDARIHGSTKTTNADGSWRAKRGVAAELTTAVEAELRGLMALNAAAAPAAPLLDFAALAVPAPVAPAAPAAPVAWTFALFMERLMPPAIAGKITPEQQANALTKFGLTAIGQLASTPNLIEAVAAQLGLEA